MRRLTLVLLLVLVAGCVSTTPVQQLPDHCSATASVAQLLNDTWLHRGKVWRLRQSTLLEIGPKKIPLEGFLRLDTGAEEARLVAMNEMGVVLFDLLVKVDGEELKRAIPQLKQIKGFSRGVAGSLRQIFLQPQPQADDHLRSRDNIQILWRPVDAGFLRFIYDCRGDLRRVRWHAEKISWQILYDHYRPVGTNRVPEKIVLNDYQHGVKLSIWIREVKAE